MFSIKDRYNNNTFRHRKCIILHYYLFYIAHLICNTMLLIPKQIKKNLCDKFINQMFINILSIGTFIYLTKILLDRMASRFLIGHSINSVARDQYPIFIQFLWACKLWQGCQNHVFSANNYYRTAMTVQINKNWVIMSVLIALKRITIKKKWSNRFIFSSDFE